MPAAAFGRYEVVLDGCVIMEGKEIGPPGFRYVRAEKGADPLVTGDSGASVAFLTIFLGRTRINGWHYYEVLQSVMEQQGVRPREALV